MEKLRKTGQWLWRNKERIILAAIILLGVYRGFVIVAPGDEDLEEPPPPPRGLPENWDEVPKPPAMAPPPPPVVDFDPVVRSNPFTWNSTQGETAPAEERAGERQWDQLSLVRIQEVPGGQARARMSYAPEGRRRYVSEGDSIGPFEVVDIDADDGSVRVRHTERNEQRTLTLQGQD